MSKPYCPARLHPIKLIAQRERLSNKFLVVFCAGLGECRYNEMGKGQSRRIKTAPKTVGDDVRSRFPALKTASTSRGDTAMSRIESPCRARREECSEQRITRLVRGSRYFPSPQLRFGLEDISSSSLPPEIISS